MSTPTAKVDIREEACASEAGDKPGKTALARSAADVPKRVPFRPWYWALLPVLALVAYATVLRVGFLSDDYMQLYGGRITTVSLSSLLPGETVGFYRPVGVLLIWQMGYRLWGFNALPLHLIQLLLHAANSLVLGLWVAWLTRRAWQGVLTGVLFAVFPLHLEAVGFIGAQFDTYSTLFGLGTLWCFTSWWRGTSTKEAQIDRGGLWLRFAASLLLYTLGVFTKESLFLFIPVLAVAAAVATPPDRLRGWLRMGCSLAPFCVPVLLNIGLRYETWHTMGGYLGPRTDIGSFFWNSLGTYARLLLSPLNPAVVGDAPAQIVGMLSTVALLAGLVFFGREQRALLALAGVWVVCVVAPAINIPPRTEDLEGNRYLYLASAGYLVGVSALIYAAVAQARHRRGVWIGAVGLAVLLSTVACWVQLRPWHTATTQVENIVDSLLRLIPTRPHPHGIAWYAQDTPSRYKGVPVLLSGLGISRIFANGGIDYPTIVRVDDAAQAPLSTDLRDAFAMRFSYNPGTDLYGVAYLAGITGNSEPPAPSEAGANLTGWDFRSCETRVLQDWNLVGARPTCAPGKGFMVQHAGIDPQLLETGLSIKPLESGARYVRLRVAVSYPQNQGTDPRGAPLVNEWYWHGPNDDWSSDRRKSLALKQDGAPHVYWTFIPVPEIEREGISALRFDPVNSNSPSTIQWIAVDLVQ